MFSTIEYRSVNVGSNLCSAILNAFPLFLRRIERTMIFLLDCQKLVVIKVFIWGVLISRRMGLKYIEPLIKCRLSATALWCTVPDHPGCMLHVALLKMTQTGS